MKEERLMILKMIEEGKISAAEGVNLLNALTGDGKGFKKTEIEEKLSKAVKTVDAFAKDVKVKVEEFAKDAEPKVKEASHFVLDKTSVAFDEIGKAIKSVMDSKSDTEVEDDIIDEDEFDIVVEEDKEEAQEEKEQQ